jgi:hypothetical protein
MNAKDWKNVKVRVHKSRDCKVKSGKEDGDSLIHDSNK